MELYSKKFSSPQIKTFKGSAAPDGGATGDLWADTSISPLEIKKLNSVGPDVWIALQEGGGGGAVTDHGMLTGLSDDDHSQYHTDARGDARYSLTSHNHSGVYSVTGHDHDLTYSAIGHDHSGVYAALSHSHVIGDVTNLQTTLDSKAATTHNHDSTYSALAHTHSGTYEAANANIQSHISNTSNPHSTTAAQVGNATAQWNADKIQGVNVHTAAPSNAQVLTYSSANTRWEAATPSGGGGGSTKELTYFKQIGTTPIESWYVAGQVNGLAMTTGALTVNRLYAMPFYSPRGGTLDRIGIQVTTLGASGAARLGIYSATSDTNLYPSTLVLDAGTISTATTGMKTLTISQALSANTLYWLVLVCGTAACTIRSLAVGGVWPIFGATNALATASGVGLYVAFTYAALPATFPASATLLSAVPIPAIGVRFSA